MTMSLRLIPAGAVIEETYLAIPGHYGIGDKFPNTDEGWDAAVTAVQAKKAALIESITESLHPFGTPGEVEQTADVQCRLDLRWRISYAGGATDTVMESYKQVDRLRTKASFAGKGA